MFRGFHHFDFGALHDKVLEKGDFKYLVLDLLKEKPRYGYEIIRALEERFLGFYTPSPGAVYPTLQMFEELGYVTVSELDGKKIYTITDAGREFLAKRADLVERILERANRSWGTSGRQQLSDLLRDLRDLEHFIHRQARRIDAEKQRQIQEVIAWALQDISAILQS